MQLFTENSEFESKDLGNGHSILDMAPKQRTGNRPVRNLLRGTTSQAASDAYIDSLIAVLAKRGPPRFLPPRTSTSRFSRIF